MARFQDVKTRDVRYHIPARRFVRSGQDEKTLLERPAMDRHAAIIASGLAVFILMQVLCHLGLKFASTAPHRFIPFFILGNVIGLTSTLILIWVYRRMNANIAMGLGVGVSFMLAQIAIAVVFKSALSWPQWVGIILAAIGLFLLAFFSGR